jgi:membrane protease YdiL (CAAX protease family)
MLETESLTGFLIEIAVLAGLGVLVAALSRVLRFKRTTYPHPHPRRSALRAILAVSVGWILVTGLIFGLSDAPPDSGGRGGETPAAGPGDAVGQILVAAILLGPVLYATHRRREPAATAGVSKEDLGRSLVMAAALVVALALGRSLTAGYPADAPGPTFGGPWALVQFGVVGFSEEFMYRGYLQQRLEAWLGNRRGWVLASVAMAMAHAGHRMAASGMSGGDALQSAAFLIPMSLFLGYVMLSTRNVAVPALLHTFINWAGV